MITAEYAAGFFDGEGHVKVERVDKRSRVGARFDYYKVAARVSQTSMPVLQALKDKYGGSISTHLERPRHKLTWYWLVGSKQVLTFFRDIYPYLIVKKEQVRLALELQGTCKMGGRHRNITPKEDRLRFDLFKQIRILNARGTSGVKFNYSYTEVQRITVTCKADDCDNKFEVLDSKIRKRFCSVTCYKRIYARRRRGVGEMKEVV